MNNIDYHKNKNDYLIDVCQYGNKIIIQYLMEHGADINFKNIYGDTPLMVACKNNNNKMLIEYLVEHEADINKGNNNGATPLFTSCFNGHENMVKYLVEHGANCKSNRRRNLFNPNGSLFKWK